MPTTNWRSEVRLTTDVTASEQPFTARESSKGGPFVIIVLGDFRGAVGDGPPGQSGPLADRHLVDIHRDNLDDVLASFDVRWEGTLEGLPGQPSAQMPVQLVIRAFDDFHPDRIAEQLLPLRSLVEIRRALEDPRRFETVAGEVMRWAEQTPAETPAEVTVEPSALLNRILDQGDTTVFAAPGRASSGDMQRFLERVVRPYLIHIDTAQQATLIDAVDQALSQQVRSVLHEPAFQRLEAAWRSVRWLVDDAETGMQLRIHMVQLTKDELQQDLTASPTLAESGLARLLLGPTSVPGSSSAALLIGNYAFAHTAKDLTLLRRLGGIAQRLRAPFVASVSPHLLGCASFTEIASASALVRRFQDASYREWQTFRRAAEARWVALALPRVLLRLPYGSETEPIDSFAFEEQVRGSDHEQLLWGNPALALGLVVARAFAEQGWGLDLGRSVQRLEGLPLYIYHEGGMALTKPCAEVLLNERIAQVLTEAGLVPLISHRDADIIALPCIQSLVEPRSPLTWTG